MVTIAVPSSLSLWMICVSFITGKPSTIWPPKSWPKVQQGE
ncbi:unnamed protein product [Gulo gulo]|uniref:ATP synthase F0 subunit 8 n=1 Tax=Gulo gulo TaxID=48420 RepID=A0A9X9LWZ2_GULGU|nr:unnamed protein product [Gulo gulo]